MPGATAAESFSQPNLRRRRVATSRSSVTYGRILLQLDVRNNAFRKDAVSKAIVMSASPLPFLHTVMSDGFTSAGAQQLSQDIHKMTALQVLGIRDTSKSMPCKTW